MAGPALYSPGYYSLMRGLNNPDITGVPYSQSQSPSWIVPGNPQQSYQNLLAQGSQQQSPQAAQSQSLYTGGFSLQNTALPFQYPSQQSGAASTADPSTPTTQIQSPVQMSAVDPFTTYMFGLGNQQQYQAPTSQNIAQYNAFGTTYGQTQDPLSTSPYEGGPIYGGVPYMTQGLVYGGVPYG